MRPGPEFWRDQPGFSEPRMSALPGPAQPAESLPQVLPAAYTWGGPQSEPPEVCRVSVAWGCFRVCVREQRTGRSPPLSASHKQGISEDTAPWKSCQIPRCSSHHGPVFSKSFAQGHSALSLGGESEDYKGPAWPFSTAVPRSCPPPAPCHQSGIREVQKVDTSRSGL